MPDCPAKHMAPLLDAIGGTNFTQLLLEEVGDTLIITDTSHTICYCGSRCAELLGFQAENLLGKSLVTLCPEPHIEFTSSGILPRLLLHKNGNKINFSNNCRELRDSDGCLLGRMYHLANPKIAPRDFQAQLLEESNHRVRNNLAIICALLDMELLQAPANERHRLLISLARTRSLALVYNYTSNSLDKLEIAQLVRSTIENVRSIYNYTDDLIPLYCPTSLHICFKRATYLSLILTEIFDFLISGKIAFKNASYGAIIINEQNDEIFVHIDINCDQQAENYPLTLPAISREIITGMTKSSLKGTATFQDENGFHLQLRFPRLLKE